MTTSRSGSIAEPALFEILLDRIALSLYPSERFVLSAALAARTSDEIERLLSVVGHRQVQMHLSPRRLELLGMIARRGAMLATLGATGRARSESTSADDGSDRDRRTDRPDLSEAQELAAALQLLQQTESLLD